jgi:hypothetical protein
MYIVPPDFQSVGIKGKRSFLSPHSQAGISWLIPAGRGKVRGLYDIARGPSPHLSPLDVLIFWESLHAGRGKKAFLFHVAHHAPGHRANAS